MLLRLALLALFLPGLCPAQADPVTNQQILNELRSIRGSLERLERSQRALLSLLRIQGDRYHLASLEAQRLPLVAREAELARLLAEDKRTAGAPAPQIRTADGGAEPAPKADDGPLRARLAEGEAALHATQARGRALDEEIARLKDRIAAAEKLIGELLPE